MENWISSLQMEEQENYNYESFVKDFKSRVWRCYLI